MEKKNEQKKNKIRCRKFKNEKNYIIEIGTKIEKKIPKFQFMGLIKLSSTSYKNLFNFFKNKNKKIDFTSFLNEAIKLKKVKINYFVTKKKWIEIDNITDLKVANKILK